MKKVDFKTEEGMVAKRYGEMNYSFKNYQGMSSQSFYNGVLWAYAKLEEERKYRKSLEETILVMQKKFDDAKNAKVICEDCGSALWRA